MSTFDTMFPTPSGHRNADDMGMPPAPLGAPPRAAPYLNAAVLTDAQLAECMLAVDDPLIWGRLGPDGANMIRKTLRAVEAAAVLADRERLPDQIWIDLIAALKELVALEDIRARAARINPVESGYEKDFLMNRWRKWIGPAWGNARLLVSRVNKLYPEQTDDAKGTG